MNESASTSLRDLRKEKTSHLITDCAMRLTDERGLDGFTMEELAEAAGVSRRTLFNYFPGKVDAVLGTTPPMDEACIAEFLAGGPSGRLVEDVLVLVDQLLTSKDFDKERIQLGRRVLTSTDRLLLAMHQRFEQVTEEFAQLILDREGDQLSPADARLLVRLLVALFDSSVQAYAADGETREIKDIFTAHIRSAVRLLG